jgi:SAM-dependent MidA family methyltransferase
MAEILGEDRFEIVEMGGGRGFLCQDILDWAKKKAPHFYQGLQYTLIETSPHLLREQRERLRPYEGEGKIGWMDMETFKKGKDHTTGCVLSNELVDAFPVHQVIFDHGKLKEIYVTQNKGQIVEEVGTLSDPRIITYFGSMGITLEEGQRAEVNLNALDWMKQVGRFLKKGFVLTIDYGYLADELYAPHRRRGTLLCYYRHQTSENPYEHLGEQDMTSHVNFTALIKEGKEAGLRFAGLVTQYRFLIALGVLQEMESLNQEASELDGLKWRLSLLHLIEPERGMGEIFKVLIQHKGMGKPLLDGLRDLNSIPWPAHSPSPHFSSGQSGDDVDRRGN